MLQFVLRFFTSAIAQIQAPWSGEKLLNAADTKTDTKRVKRGMVGLT